VLPFIQQVVKRQM